MLYQSLKLSGVYLDTALVYWLYSCFFIAKLCSTQNIVQQNIWFSFSCDWQLLKCHFPGLSVSLCAFIHSFKSQNNYITIYTFMFAQVSYCSAWVSSLALKSLDYHLPPTTYHPQQTFQMVLGLVGG